MGLVALPKSDTGKPFLCFVGLLLSFKDSLSCTTCQIESLILVVFNFAKTYHKEYGQNRILNRSPNESDVAFHFLISDVDH